ncbi:hypothetical protein HPP92_006300 [Vanilla planifolia]|uniref:Uncharacterized protein n=1 Tax=Vanilla planifolia TaxID=51239 RepID=A0A835RNB4_VANPL|nr:hypothetical protein HPP92_006300 [Vanilla planifolia]
MRERDLVEEEAVRLRNVVRRRRKELRSRMTEVEREESERKRMVDERANARCKYENDIVTDTATRDASSPLLYQVYGSPRSGTDLSLQGTYNQLLERQVFPFPSFNEIDVNIYGTAYRQFVATEDALNKAAEAKSISQKLVKRLHGNGEVATTTLHSGVQSQNLGNTRQFQVNEDFKRKIEEDVCGCERALLESMGSVVATGHEAHVAAGKSAFLITKKSWSRAKDPSKNTLYDISLQLFNIILRQRQLPVLHLLHQRSLLFEVEMVLATLRHSWRKVSVINIVILIVLVVVYTFACGFRNSKWMDNGEAYGQARMTKSRPSRF